MAKPGILMPEQEMGILARLPPKDLLRFKCIRKSWYDLIISPGFIARHLSVSRNKELSSTTSIVFKRTVLKDMKHKHDIFNVLRDNDNSRKDIYVSLLDLYNDHDADDQKNLHSFVDDLVIPLPYSICPFSFQIAGHCDGILCLINTVLEDVAFCNPALKEFKFLPRSPLLLPHRHPEDIDGIETAVNAVGFGYDYKTQEYKIVRVVLFITGICYTLPSKAEIWTLGSNAWRDIKYEQDCHVSWTATFELHFKGIYYWNCLTYPTPGQEKEAILTFDMSEETFEVIDIPENMRAGDGFVKYLSVWKESVVLIACQGEGPKTFDLWSLDETSTSGVKGSWTKQLVVGPIECEIPLVFWKSDELLLTMSDGIVASYNLGDQSLKYLLVHGIEDPPNIQAFVYVNSLISVKGNDKVEKCIDT